MADPIVVFKMSELRQVVREELRAIVSPHLPEELMTVSELATHWGVSEKTVMRRLRDKVVKAKRVGRKSAWQYNIAKYWVCAVNQAAYGHRATKRTWLIYVGKYPPGTLNWARTIGSGVVSGARNNCNRPLSDRVWPAEASRSPILFADALIRLAENCGGAS